MSELIERLREDADGYGHGPTTLTNEEIVELRSLLREAAAALEAAREDGDDAARYRWLKANDNAYLLAEDVIDDQIAGINN